MNTVKSPRIEKAKLHQLLAAIRSKAIVPQASYIKKIVGKTSAQA